MRPRNIVSLKIWSLCVWGLWSLLVGPSAPGVWQPGVSTALSQENLQITEIWPGGLPGTDTTSDWFEVTNLGDQPADQLDGNLYYDDNSDDPNVADPMMGIDRIAPGESVVYLTSWENRFDNMREAAVDAFVEMWAPLDGVQVGVVSFGGGLGGQGDAVNIFDANTSVANTIDREEYLGPTTEASFVAEADGSWFARVAQVGVLGARRGNLPADDMGAPPPVGSPGIVVPEPSTITICAGICLGCLICCRTTFIARQSRIRDVL